MLTNKVAIFKLSYKYLVLSDFLLNGEMCNANTDCDVTEGRRLSSAAAAVSKLTDVILPMLVYE